MNTISASKHKAPYASEEYAVLTVDGLPIYEWITAQIFNHAGEDTTDKLVPAQVWLVDDEEARMAWRLLEPLDESSTVVPLLVCPDDRDLSCTVVVVEQVVDRDRVRWERFGLCMNSIQGIVTSVQWSEDSQRAEFNRAQFDAAFLEFKRLSPDM